jgi:hypothetical protein
VTGDGHVLAVAKAKSQRVPIDQPAAVDLVFVVITRNSSTSFRGNVFSRLPLGDGQLIPGRADGKLRAASMFPPPAEE